MGPFGPGAAIVTSPERPLVHELCFCVTGIDSLGELQPDPEYLNFNSVREAEDWIQSLVAVQSLVEKEPVGRGSAGTATTSSEEPKPRSSPDL